MTATRLDTPVERVGSSVSVITSEDIRRLQATSVVDVLQRAGGLTLARAGGPGQSSSLYLRGGSPGFTRVMIDGVKMNDPSGIGSAFDFGTLTVDNIERIEVLRGPQSTLYGSDAMAGVINIITRKATQEPTAAVSVEGGSYGTWRTDIRGSGSETNVSYSAAYSHFETDGFSTLDEEDGYTEDDGNRNDTVSARIGYKPVGNAGLDLIVRHSRTRTDYDAYDSSFMPSESGKIENDETYVRAQGDLALMDGFWTQQLGASRAAHRRKYLDAPGLPDEHYDGDTTGLDWQHNLFVNDMNTVTVGTDWQEDEASTRTLDDVSSRLTGVFGQDTIALGERSFTTLGIRLDDHSKFGSEETHRVTTAFLIPETGTRLKGSYGTGFQAPSLYELFADDEFTTGNPDLDPQTSTGWDAGFEQEVLEKRVTVGATWFRIDYDDLTAWQSGAAFGPGRYVNVNEGTSEGVETFGQIRVTDAVAVKGTYDYLDNSSGTGDTSFTLNRPRHRASAGVDWDVTRKLSVNVNSVFTGSRTDFGSQSLPSHTLFNLASRYAVNKCVALTGRVENLFDKEYQEFAGYGTAGISAYGGVEATF